jgi:HD-GYP domain-containing protein (c-di-GMP phosphodiesterase class II)
VHEGTDKGDVPPRESREATVKRLIRLRGINGDVKDRVWDADSIMRVGRLESHEIPLDDTSVSRNHAVIRLTERGWVVKDLGSTNGTFLNGRRLDQEESRLRDHDMIQFGGKATMLVELVDETPATPGPGKGDHVVVEASTATSYEEALLGIPYDRNQRLRPDDQLQALLRASQLLCHMQNEKELYTRILHDSVRTLRAQRGAIVLANGPTRELQLQALETGQNDLGSRTNFSQSLAHRSFKEGKSILYSSGENYPEIDLAKSIHDGAMASVLCVLLRTPRGPLGVLHLDRNQLQPPFTEDDLHLADALAASVSAGIETAQLLREQKEMYEDTIRMVAQIIETRDDYTGKHTDRVTRYSQLISGQLCLLDADQELIRIGTPLHDIGKIGIDDAILRKPGPLTAEEFEIMKTHTVKGAKILSVLPGLAKAIPIARSHHERWDGGGYPDRLAGEAIPLLARIVAVADAFDAMTSHRPYRKAMPAEVAFAEVQKQTGRQFDPECAAAFLAPALRQPILDVMQSQDGGDENLLRPAQQPLKPVVVARPAAAQMAC